MSSPCKWFSERHWFIFYIECLPFGNGNSSRLIPILFNSSLEPLMYGKTAWLLLTLKGSDQAKNMPTKSSGVGSKIKFAW